MPIGPGCRSEAPEEHDSARRCRWRRGETRGSAEPGLTSLATYNSRLIESTAMPAGRFKSVSGPEMVRFGCVVVGRAGVEIVDLDRCLFEVHEIVRDEQLALQSVDGERVRLIETGTDRPYGRYIPVRRPRIHGDPVRGIVRDEQFVGGARKRRKRSRRPCRRRCDEKPRQGPAGPSIAVVQV